MNWEALGALAELLGAIGVIATLLYLSRQINHNSKQLEGSSTIAVHNYQRTLTEEMCSRPISLSIKGAILPCYFPIPRTKKMVG